MMAVHMLMISVVIELVADSTRMGLMTTVFQIHLWMNSQSKKMVSSVRYSCVVGADAAESDEGYAVDDEDEQVVEVDDGGCWKV
jgi:hypothetical protein